MVVASDSEDWWYGLVLLVEFLLFHGELFPSWMPMVWLWALPARRRGGHLGVVERFWRLPQLGIEGSKQRHHRQGLDAKPAFRHPVCRRRCRTRLSSSSRTSQAGGATPRRSSSERLRRRQSSSTNARPDLVTWGLAGAVSPEDEGRVRRRR